MKPRHAVYFRPGLDQRDLAVAYARDHAVTFGNGWLRVDADGGLTLMPPESIIIDRGKIAESPNK